MSLIDIILLILLGFGVFLGFKRGLLRELVSFVGIILITVLSFLLKNSLSVLFYKNLPFFEFNHLIKGSTIVNILLYEIIAFLIIFSVLLILLKILIKITNIIEKILKMTIILGIPSKILGAIFGFIKTYLLLFIIIYVLSLPIFSIKTSNSKIGKIMLNDTPILSSFIKDNIVVFNEFNNLVEEYKSKDNAQEFDEKALNLMIKYGAITEDNAKWLIKNGKLKKIDISSY